jgi:hypothetical protein
LGEFWHAYNLILIGFPPVDATLRSWFRSEEMYDPRTSQRRLHYFVRALLTITRTALENIENQIENKDDSEATETERGVISRQAKLASAFRDLMTKGQSFKSPNAYRENFYNKVIESTNKVNFYEFPHFSEDDHLSRVWIQVTVIRGDWDSVWQK